MKAINYIFLLMFLVLSINMVGAVPPVQTTVVSENGLEIEATNSLYLKQNTDHTFHFRVYNASNNIFIDPDNVTCSMGIINNYGDYVIIVPDASGVDYRFDVEVSGGNFTNLGVYHKGINCLLDDGTSGGVLTQSFEITATGDETPDGVIILGFILMMMAIFIFMIVYLIKAIGLMIEANFDILDIAYAWGLFFGLLGLNMFAGIYLGNAEVTDFLELLIKILAFPMVVVPVVAFFLSLFRTNREKKEKEAEW